MADMATTNKIKPFKLPPGAKIGVVSPASRPLYEEKLYQGVNYLKKLGYEVFESKHVLDQKGYLAGEDSARVQDLNEMFNNPELDAVICSRGGYGTPRIIDQIDFEAIKRNPKIFMGYSDITSLSLAIWKKTGLVTFSGPMVAVEMGNGIDLFTEKHCWNMLTSTKPVGRLSEPDNFPIEIYRQGKAEGILLGGCLSLINVLLGTPYIPDFTGAILFIEDIGEEPHGVDRYLAQLKLAGILDKVSGIVLGQFLDCQPGEPDKPSLELKEIFDDYFLSLKIPIISNFAYGHGAIKHTMPFGIKAAIDTENGGLFITEEAVLEK